MMSLKKLYITATILMLTVFAYADQNKEIKGVYETLSGHTYSFDGKQVEIIEFLSFYCGHCYHFEKSIPVIKGNFPKKIKWRTVPIFWGKGSPKPGEAFFLAEEAGKGEEMRKALFKAIFVDKRDIGDVEVLEDIGVKVGLGFDFSRRLRTGDKAKEAGEALLMAQAYDVNETPSLIIAGNLKTSPGMVQGDTGLLQANTITILKSIFKK